MLIGGLDGESCVSVCVKVCEVVRVHFLLYSINLYTCT